MDVTMDNASQNPAPFVDQRPNGPGVSKVDPSDPAAPMYRLLAKMRSPVTLRDLMIHPVRTGYIGQEFRPSVQYNGISHMWRNIGSFSYNALQLQVKASEHNSLTYDLSYSIFDTLTIDRFSAFAMSFIRASSICSI